MQQDTPDMGYLAESACRELAAAVTAGEPDGRRVLAALREFMWEAKKGDGQP